MVRSARRCSTRPTSGIARSQPDDLRGGDVAFNADVVRRVLAGERGPVRDAVLLNAAAAIAAYDARDRQRHRAADRRLGERAEAIDSGAAKAKLDAWVAAVALSLSRPRIARACCPARRSVAEFAAGDYSSAPRENAASRSWVE